LPTDTQVNTNIWQVVLIVIKTKNPTLISI